MLTTAIPRPINRRLPELGITIIDRYYENVGWSTARHHIESVKRLLEQEGVTMADAQITVSFTVFYGWVSTP